MGRSHTEVHPLRPPNGTVHSLLIIDRWHGTVAGKAPPVKGGIQKSLTKYVFVVSLWAGTGHDAGGFSMFKTITDGGFPVNTLLRCSVPRETAIFY